jgi:hypothetical protein
MDPLDSNPKRPEDLPSHSDMLAADNAYVQRALNDPSGHIIKSALGVNARPTDAGAGNSGNIFDKIHAESGSQASGNIFDRIHASAPKSKYTVGGFLSNVVSSGGKMIGDVAHAGTHLGETLDTLGAIPIGLGEKAVSAVTGKPDLGPGWNESAHIVDNILNHLKNRYGSIEKAKESLYTDPVGVAGDLATVAGGVGGAARATGMLADAAGAGRTASAIGRAGRVAESVSNAVDPMANVARGAGKAVQAATPGGLAPRLYQSALKPSPGLANTKEIVNTGLENRIPVTEAGAHKISALVADLNDKIAQRINAGAASGKTVDPQAVAGRVAPVEQRFGMQVSPTRDLKEIENVKQDFLGGPGAGPIPADQAQAMKVGTYRNIDYGTMGKARIEAQKALARGLKEELETQFPEIGPQNKAEGKLLDLQGPLERAVRRIDNHQMIGLGTPAAAVAGHAVAGAPAAVAGGLFKLVFDDPGLKSKLAIALHRGSKSTGNTVPLGKAIARVNTFAKTINEFGQNTGPEQVQGQ